MGKQDVTVQQRKQLLKTLAELGGGQFSAEDDIIQEGTRIVLPLGMSIKRAIAYLSERMAADDEVTRFTRTFKYRPWDGAVCTWRALQKVFGMVGMSGQKGSMFGDTPPEMREIPVGPNKVISVPWGVLNLPALVNTTITPGSQDDPDLGPVYKLTIDAPRKFKAQVEGIFVVVEHELQESSIYRGQAFDGQDMPEFLDLSGITPEKVVYAEETLVQLEASIWSVMRYRHELEVAGISRKRSALLHGPYGTGKTLGGFLTALNAVESGWTFLYVRPGKDDVERVIQTARLYQPACVFVEDLDTVANPDDSSTDSASRLLDIFDGITAKGTELMIVLTTNHPDRIHKGMLRPGRLDAVIEIAELDEAGITKLIKGSLPPGALEEHIDWTAVHEAGKGFLPAYLKEGADRAYRYALVRTGKPEAIKLNTADLVHAMNGLRPQLELMEGAKEHAPSDAVGHALKEAFKEGMREHIVADWDPEQLGTILRPSVLEEVKRKG